MNRLLLAVALLATALFATEVSAQPAGGRGMGGMVSRGMLLRQDSVQTELGITAEQKAAVAAKPVCPAAGPAPTASNHNSLRKG